MDTTSSPCDEVDPIAPMEPSAMEQNLTEIESLCMSCRQQGVTRLLLVRVPHFGELVISSFACPACGAANRELMPAAAIRDRGVEYHLRVRSRADLDRQLVRSHTASLMVPSVELDMPAGRARLTTVEGVLLGALDDLSPTALELEQQGDSRLTAFLARLRALLSPETLSAAAAGTGSVGEGGFELILRDPSGNSFIERLADEDEQLQLRHFERSAEEDAQLGICAPAVGAEAEAEAEAGNAENLSAAPPPPKQPRRQLSHTHAEAEPISADAHMNNVPALEPAPAESNDRLFEFQDACPRCSQSVETRMTMLSIPHFGQVLLMATACESCGFREKEVKSALNVRPLGVRYRLQIAAESDLKRDLLKSETCAICIPELELETDFGTLGGKYTTVEGLLRNMYEQLAGVRVEAEPARGAALNVVLERLSAIISLSSTDMHLVLNDPAGNSYLQSLAEMSAAAQEDQHANAAGTMGPTADSLAERREPASEQLDARLVAEYYERSAQQNAFLGLE